MGLVADFFKGRNLSIPIHTSPSHANDRINNRTDTPVRGVFLSALCGYASGESIELEYYSLLWPFPAITFSGVWNHSQESATLRGKLKPSFLLKTAFILIFLMPFLFFYQMLTHEIEISLHLMANNFGFLVLAGFMDIVVLLLASILLRNAETRIQRLLT